MQASGQGSAQSSWLTLLLLAVLFVSMTNPVFRAGPQLQEIGLESGYLPGSPEDESLVTGLPSGVFANQWLSSPAGTPERLSPIGTDAYPCVAIHGPPDPDYPV